MTRAVFILTSFLFIVSCKKHKLEGEKTILTGKWKLIYTVEPYSDQPNDTNFVQDEIVDLEFLEKGKLLFYRDGKVARRKRTIFSYFEYQEDVERYTFYIKDNNISSNPYLSGSLIPNSKEDTLYVFNNKVDFIDDRGIRYFVRSD